MPEMSETLFSRYKVENCFYGEFIDMMDPGKGWILDASEPRYLSNYYGIRNRLGILNENYVYADFKSRVLGCYYLIRSLADYVSKYKSEIRDMLKDVDNKTVAKGLNPSVTDSFAIEYKVRSAPGKVTVRTFEADMFTDTIGRRSYKKSDRQKDVTIPYFIDYYPAKNVRFPFAYLLTVNDPEITGLLKLHGIKAEKLLNDTKIDVERFEISELKGAVKLNQGHYTENIKGKYVNEKMSFPAGTIIVRTAQPLANVAAYLLEPESNDGLLTWNFFDRYLVPQWGIGYNPYPVYKVINSVNILTVEMK
jgi:hypothetical protein